MFNYDKLNNAIEASGKTRTYLCQKLGRPAYYLRDVIRQKNRIPEEYQRILADELGVSVEYLNDEQEKAPAGNDERSARDIALEKIEDMSADELLELMAAITEKLRK